MATHSHLSEADQKQVDEFLKEGINETERNPFRPGKLLLWITVTIIIFGVISRAIGYYVVYS